MKSEEWYLWEKAPGKIGVSWRQQFDRHCDTFIDYFSGSIDEAIKYAKQLEEKGYDVCPKDSNGKDVKKAEPAIVFDVIGNQLSFGITEESEVPRKARKPRTVKAKKKEPFEGYEPEGQLSLLEYI